MFVVSVIFTIHKQHIEQFRKIVFTHAARTLDLEPGCRQFDVGFDANDDSRVFLYEAFEDRAAFDKHSESEHLRHFFEKAGDWIASKEANRWQLADLPR